MDRVANRFPTDIVRVVSVVRHNRDEICVLWVNLDANRRLLVALEVYTVKDLASGITEDERHGDIGWEGGSCIDLNIMVSQGINDGVMVVCNGWGGWTQWFQ